MGAQGVESGEEGTGETAIEGCRGRGEDAPPGHEAGSAWRGYACLVLMVLIGSTGAMAAKYVLRHVPLPMVPIARFGLAGLCLLPWADFKRLRSLTRGDVLRVAIAGALCIPINQAFFLTGAKLAPTTHIGLIYATCPLFVLLLAWWIGLERMRGDRLVGVLASVAGVGVIGLGNLWGSATPGGELDARRMLWGDLLMVGAVVTWAAYMAASKPLVGRLGAMTSLAGIFLVGSVLDIPVAALTWTPEHTAQFLAVPWQAWAGLLYMSLVVSLVGLGLQNIALRKLDASQVATFGNMSPILTVVWGVLLLGEGLTQSLLIGGLLTIGGIVWTGHRGARAPLPKPKRVVAELPKARVVAPRASAPMAAMPSLAGAVHHAPDHREG